MILTLRKAKANTSDEPASVPGLTVGVLWRGIEIALLIVLLVSQWELGFNERVPWLGLFIPIAVGRLIVLRRVITRSAIDLPLIALIVLALLNLEAAPYTWGPGALSRIILGAGLVWVVGDWGRTPGMVRVGLAAGLVLAVVLGGAALVSSHYNIKSIVLQPVIDLLPVVRGIPLIGGGFNVNEIGGALTLLLPGAACIVLTSRSRVHPGVRALGWLALLLLSTALLLGQSRMAIFGVLFACAGCIFGLMHPGWRRIAALSALAGIGLFEVAMVSNLLLPDGTPLAVMQERETGSQTARVLIWTAAAQAIGDHPLTGVGLNQFRRLRDQYPVPGYERQVLPHAHNIFLQTGADLGLPGIAVYLVWTGVFGWMLVRVIRSGGDSARTAAFALGAGVAAHLIFSQADAIPLSDRFIFLYWLVIGAGVALFVMITRRRGDMKTGRSR